MSDDREQIQKLKRKINQEREWTKLLPHCFGKYSRGDPFCDECTVSQQCRLEEKPIENDEESSYDFDQWIERKCRKAVNRAWKRQSERSYGEYLDPDTNPETQGYFAKTQAEIVKRKKRQLKVELSEKAEKIANELPNLPKWIRQNPVIKDSLKRTHFLQVIDYTRAEKVEQDQRWSLTWTGKLHAERYSFMKDGQEVLTDYIVVKIDNDWLAKYLALDERTTRKYLQALCRAGILVDLGKPGKNKPKLYASGYWSTYWNEGKKGRTRVYFLKDTDEWREVLCRLNLQF